MIDLPRLARAQGRRRNITLRPVIPTQAQALELARIITPAATIWRDAAESILAGYDPKPMVHGKPPGILDALVGDSPGQMQAAIATTTAEFLHRLITEITPAMRRWAVRAEAHHRSRWAAAVKAGTGIDLGMMLTAQPVAETLDAWLARTVALVTNVSDQAKGRISDAVFRGYSERIPVREVAREIRKAADMGRARSIRIASHQNNALSDVLDQERMAESGIDLWKFRHSGKLHPREEHRVRDGEIYTLGANKQVKPDGSPMPSGSTIPSGRGPGELPGCGCRRQAYLALMATL